MNSETNRIFPVAEESLASPPAVQPATKLEAAANTRAGLQLSCLILGYIGIYLCRKNFAVAVPMIQKSFGATKAQIGMIESYATVAYALGKLFWGPTIDRIGGRTCFLLALIGVAIFCATGAFVTTLSMLAFVYTANRFFGSGGWGGMVKQVPDWFPSGRLPLAMAFLSLSFVFGGVCAFLLAGQVAETSGDNWHAVMGFPALILAALIGICWRVLPGGKKSRPAAGTKEKSAARFVSIFELAKIPQFWVVCALSFVLTITRETFNVWTVDFLRTEGGNQMSSKAAAFLSTPFDAAGAAGILLLGWLLGYLSPSRRNWLLFGMLGFLAALIYALPTLAASKQLWIIVVALGSIGFLSYGPYSLLAGILAVEIHGKESVATVAGFVDASGYLAGIVSGYCFGKILDHGGYSLGFHFLGLTTFTAALLCLGLYPNKQKPDSQARPA
jgi:sugar phosphate permease